MSVFQHPAVRDVWEGIRSRPGRVGLSFLAVSIGILALTFLLSVTGGLREKARLLVQELGAHVAAILPPDRPPRDAGPSLTGRHADLLSGNLPGRRVSAVRRFQVRPDGWEQTVALVATDAQLAQVRRWRVAAGRFLDPLDVAGGERHAVITRALSTRMDWNVGGTISLQGVPFTVVGILDTGGRSAEGESPEARLQLGEETVFVPHTVYAPWTPSLTGPARALDAIFIQAAPGEPIEQLVRAGRRILSSPDAAAAESSWVTPETLLRGIRRLQQTIGFAVGSIAGLCLLLGGTTLMSLMLANVRDRIPEIGLRRALGARARDVSLLFVLESCAITMAAAVAGTVSAGIALRAAGAMLPIPLALHLSTFLIPVLASLGLGAIFSYAPARAAARVAPAEALRSE